MLSSKLFKFTNILDNEKFTSDFLKLAVVDQKAINCVLSYQLEEKHDEHEEEIFEYFESKGINLNHEDIKSVYSVIFYIEGFYNENFIYANEIEEVKEDLKYKELINSENQDSIFKNLEIIYASLKKIRVTNNIKKYKENFLPTIKNITYSTNMKLVKSTINTYSNSKYEYDDNVVDIISSTTMKLELYNYPNDIFIQLSKENIENMIKILEFAKKDISISYESIKKLKDNK